MATISTNLYEKIIAKEASLSEKLRVISGYGSAPFLKKVVTEYPSLEIELFLGMTQQGISEKNHQMFNDLSQGYSNISVYYQVFGKYTHMKILEFTSLNNRNTYIGSANFTENGFVEQREIMTPIEDDLETLFVQQRANSMLCCDEDILNKINVYPDEIYLEKKINEYEQDIKYNDSEKHENPLNEDLGPYGDSSEFGISSDDSNNKYFPIKNFYKKLPTLRLSANNLYYKEFDLPIVLPPINNALWDRRGINAWTEGGTPVLEQTPKLHFETVFPSNQKFEIVTDDGCSFVAILTGKFNRNLQLINGDLFQYIQKRIGAADDSPISYFDLIKFGFVNFHFVRLSETKYCMTFS